MADLILYNGRLSTPDPETRNATAIAMTGGKITAVGSDHEVMMHKGDITTAADLGGKRVIPGLDDSHTHLIRGGPSYNMELRRENAPSVADALAMLRRQAANTPAPQWIRVVGGWSEFQFAERHMPTLQESNGAGENLAWPAEDFEDFLEPRPDPAPVMEEELEKIVELLATNEWPFRIHATYDETIDSFLTVFERVNSKTQFKTCFTIDQAETTSKRDVKRINALGGDTDATRVASYHPWIAMHWITTGKTVGGITLYVDENLLTREEALAIWTMGSAWFSSEQDVKDKPKTSTYADLAVLSDDLMGLLDDKIRSITSEMTLVGGKIVFAGGSFIDHDPPLPPASPDWSDNARFASPTEQDVPQAPAATQIRACHDGFALGCGIHGHNHEIAWISPIPVRDKGAFWGALGC